MKEDWAFTSIRSLGKKLVRRERFFDTSLQTLTHFQPFYPDFFFHLFVNSTQIEAQPFVLSVAWV